MREILDIEDNRLNGNLTIGQFHLYEGENECLYEECSVKIKFSPGELQRLKRHFKHLTTERLHAVIKCTKLHDSLPKLMLRFEEVKKSCDAC